MRTRWRWPLLILGMVFVPLQAPPLAQASTPVPTNISASTTWTADGSPYIIQGQTYVRSPAVLTIEPGVVVKFVDCCYSGAFLNVGGGASLLAQGARDNHIVFTSLKDDSVGGDTNGDGSASAPSPSDWYRIYVTGSVSMQYVDLRYGGRSSVAYGHGQLEVASNDVNVDHITSRFSGSSALRIGGGTAFVTNSEFTDSPYGVSLYNFGLTLSHSNLSYNSNTGFRGPVG